MSRPITKESLRVESAPYKGSCGDSATARNKRFLPAFKNTENGQVQLARLPNGQVAPMHLISYLPPSWAARRDTDGTVLELVGSVVAGFVRDGRFYTREEASTAEPG